MSRYGWPFVEGERRVTPITRFRSAPVKRRSRPAETRIIKPVKRNYCALCGGPADQYSAHCRLCFDVKQFKSDQSRLRNAKVVTAEAHGNEWIYCDGRGYNEGYFESIEDLLQYCDDEQMEPPCYVHPAYPTEAPKIDLGSVLEHLYENEPEGFETSDLDGIDELEAAVAAFNAKQHSHSWMCALHEVIILDDARFEILLTTDRHGLPDVTYLRRSPSGKSKREMAQTLGVTADA